MITHGKYQYDAMSHLSLKAVGWRTITGKNYWMLWKPSLTRSETVSECLKKIQALLYIEHPYVCRLCQGWFVSEAKALEHMAYCHINPANKGCMTCSHHVAELRESKVHLQCGAYEIDKEEIQCKRWEALERKVFQNIFEVAK